MKAKFMKGFIGLSGKLDELVYCIEKKSGAVWTRDYVIPRKTAHNREIGSSGKNIGVFWKSVSEGYMDDLKDYADRYNLATIGYGGRISGYTALMRMLFTLKQAIPSLDLKTITPQDVVDMDLPIKSVWEAIQNGVIAPVKRGEQLDNRIL